MLPPETTGRFSKGLKTRSDPPGGKNARNGRRGVIIAIDDGGGGVVGVMSGLESSCQSSQGAKWIGETKTPLAGRWRWKGGGEKNRAVVMMAMRN